jgi:hypothetical protein
MLQRWIQENKRFLGGAIGAFLLLLIFNWFFVDGNRTKARSELNKARKGAKELARLYKPKRGDGGTKPLKPLSRTLKKVKQQRDAFREALKSEVALYGNAPSNAFLLPGDQGGDNAKNYYFSQRAIVMDELEAAAAANAVNVEDDEFGLSSNPTMGADPEVTVRKLLWQAQIVRRAVGAAIAAGVDTIQSVQLTGNLTERTYADGGYRVYGIPLRVVVTGNTAHCVQWLESLQDTARGYVVIVATKATIDNDVLGNVEMTVDLMGIQHEVAEGE